MAGDRMTYRGTVRNGMVVIDGPERPPEDASVVVAWAGALRPATGAQSPPNEGGPPRTWAEVLRGVIGKVDDLPEDMAENHGRYVSARR
jgi:hypothetical protein